LDETPQAVENVSRYAIGHLEALLTKYGPIYRADQESRYDEVDAKEVAFKAFKVAYERRAV